MRSHTLWNAQYVAGGLQAEFGSTVVRVGVATVNSHLGELGAALSLCLLKNIQDLHAFMVAHSQ